MVMTGLADLVRLVLEMRADIRIKHCLLHPYKRLTIYDSYPTWCPTFWQISTMLSLCGYPEHSTRQL